MIRSVEEYDAETLVQVLNTQGLKSALDIGLISKGTFRIMRLTDRRAWGHSPKAVNRSSSVKGPALRDTGDMNEDAGQYRSAYRYSTQGGGYQGLLNFE
jgi:hypothetical protein